MSTTRDNPPGNWQVGAERIGDSDVYLRLGPTPAESIIWHWCGKQDRWIGSAITLHTIVQRDPVTIRASLACPDDCGWHGFITEGRWAAA